MTHPRPEAPYTRSVTRTRTSSAARDGGEPAESRQERKLRTRQALLDTTLALAAQRGFAAVSLREVARGAGIVPTAFYRHFESMEDLGATVVGDAIAVLRAALRGEGSRTGGVRSVVELVPDLLVRVRGDEAPFRFLVREVHGGVPEIRDAIDRELRLMEKELAIDLSRLPQSANWSARDLETAAELVVAIVMAALGQLLDGDRDDSEVVQRAERQLSMLFVAER